MARYPDPLAVQRRPASVLHLAVAPWRQSAASCDDGCDSRRELVEEFFETTARAALAQVLERSIGEALPLAFTIISGEGRERRLGAALVVTAQALGLAAGIEAEPLSFAGQCGAFGFVARLEASQDPRLALGFGYANRDDIAVARALASLLETDATL
jgi:hypothetical protein